jgi:predicted metal-binding membrane protein
MDRLQKILLISLVSISAASWLVSQAFQVEMMSAMMAPYNALSVTLFAAVWTAGMAAMMFPAISPVVLLYNRLIKNASTGGLVMEELQDKGLYSARMVLFVGCYLLVWALTGLALLLAWSLPLNGALAAADVRMAAAVYGSILVLAGAYQFSPLKSKCLGYCESPMSLFMRRWRSGTAGAVTMGAYHGLYCLGCCWPYFLLMVALGWMDILWMALFAGIIFGEKMWSRGIWVARAAGVGLAISGVMVLLGAVNISAGHNGMIEMDQKMPGIEMQQQEDSMNDNQGAMPSGTDDGGRMSGMDMQHNDGSTEDQNDKMQGMSGMNMQ